jgi:TRAP transporter TAXI family solute receptor
MLTPPRVNKDGNGRAGMAGSPSWLGIEKPVSFSRRYAWLIVLAAMLAVTVIGGTVYYAFRPVTFRIAVGPPGSDNTRVIQAIAQAFARDRAHIRLRTVVTDGANASAEAIEANKVDFAVIRDDLGVPKNVAAIATLRKNVGVLWAPTVPAAKGAKKSKAKQITKVEDLVGRRVGVIGRTQANVNMLKVVLEQYGIGIDKVEIVQIGTNVISEVLRKGSADAFFAVGPVNSRITAEAIAASIREVGPPNFIAIEAADAIAQKNPAYEAMEISAGAFGGAPPKPEDAVKTVGVAHHIVARKALGETRVTDFTRQLFSVRSAIITEIPHAASLETPDTDKDASIPAHPGAAAFVDGEEKSFLERYSDLIWWILMGLSALGSVGAWFAGKFSKDPDGNFATVRASLMQLLATARAATSSEELDAIQLAADELLQAALKEIDGEKADDTMVSTFTLVLQQVHAAVADRRAVLAAGGVVVPAPLSPSAPAPSRESARASAR